MSRDELGLGPADGTSLSLSYSSLGKADTLCMCICVYICVVKRGQGLDGHSPIIHPNHSPSPINHVSTHLGEIQVTLVSYSIALDPCGLVFFCVFYLTGGVE